jgi:hypothetical protein
MKEMDERVSKRHQRLPECGDVEALRLARRIGKHSLSQYSVRPFSVALCRAGASTQAA